MYLGRQERIGLVKDGLFELEAWLGGSGHCVGVIAGHIFTMALRKTIEIPSGVDNTVV